MSTFNDDLSADMNDPEFAAEFERTTDEVRRERYAAAIAEAAEPNDLDIGHWIHEWYPEADAASAVARLDAESTISRVRAVLDEWYGTSDASALSAEIRTALNGESS